MEIPKQLTIHSRLSLKLFKYLLNIFKNWEKTSNNPLPWSDVMFIHMHQAPDLRHPAVLTTCIFSTLIGTFSSPCTLEITHLAGVRDTILRHNKKFSSRIPREN